MIGPSRASFLPVLASLALTACPGGSADGSGDDNSGGIPIPGTGTGTATEGDDLGDESQGTGADTTAGGCAEELVCGENCCDPTDTCEAGVCVPDCGDQPACGDVCCGGGEVCYVGQCIVPGGSCDSAVCATTVSSDCNDGAPFCPYDKLCHDGSVGDPCDGDSDCAEPLLCNPQKLCQEGLEGEPCAGDSDCSDAAPFCAIDNLCHDGGPGDPCSGNSQCQSDSCDANVCQ